MCVIRNTEFTMATIKKEDVTEHELRLVEVMTHLKVEPEKVETAEELEDFMKKYDKDGTEK